MKEQELRRRVMQNLLDAGCGEALAREFWRLFECGRHGEGVALLARHRCLLLERCHAEQRRIDCLDYLIYQLEYSETFRAERK